MPEPLTLYAPRMSRDEGGYFYTGCTLSFLCLGPTLPISQRAREVPSLPVSKSQVLIVSKHEASEKSPPGFSEP